MTPEQVARVRASWSLVVPISATLSQRFYEFLFSLDPSVRPLFTHVDEPSQQRKLMQTLAVVVAGLDDVESLLPAVEALGRRHAGYGATNAHYALVGDALCLTLADALGEAYDADTDDAWRAAYAILAGAMQRAAAVALAPQAS